MSEASKDRRHSSRVVTKSVRILVTVWTLLIVGLLLWVVRQEMQDARELVRNEARAHFFKDQAFRFWGASHGGVYVLPTERTPPNPYLSHVAGRDVETTSGKKLTLMNPAYMVRQLMEDYDELYGIKGHITSLKPLRPENAPDDWERAALESFERGETEVDEFTEIDGKLHLRLMRPMMVEQPCLKCHEQQGYQEGDVRGGVGVSVPAGPLFAAERAELIQHSSALGLIWLLGLVGIALGTRHVREHVCERERAEERLLAAERMQAEAEKLAATGRMAARVAHEINNPLAGIKNSFRLVKAAVPKEHPDSDMVTIIDRELDRVALIVKQMYELHSPRAEKLGEMPIDQAIRDVMAMLEPLCRRNRVTTRLDDLPTGLAVNAPEGSLQQIFYNLMGNAVEASPFGGEVVVRVHLEEDGETVVFECRDRGRGIPVDLQDRIFEPFFTTKDSTASPEGMGLGLSVVKSIVEAVGGTIHFESTLDIGTVFRVGFPLSRKEEEEP